MNTHKYLNKTAELVNHVLVTACGENRETGSRFSGLLEKYQKNIVELVNQRTVMICGENSEIGSRFRGFLVKNKKEKYLRKILSN